MASSAGDDHPPPGAVELREDVPLTAPAAARRCAGPRLIAAAFAALSVAITLALLTQIYCGDYEVVPHGSVASSVGACSEGGARLLRVGGGALDAAAAAALCHAASSADPLALDASGSLLYWEYRRAHADAPTLAEWGAAGGAGSAAGGGPGGAGSAAGGGPGGAGSAGGAAEERPPLLLVALAALHVQHGLLPWSRVLQPAIDLAVSGDAHGAVKARLRAVQHNSSAELCTAWRCEAQVRAGPAARLAAGAWRAYAGGAAAARGGPAAGALLAALAGDDAGVAEWLRQGGASNVTAGSGLAVVDPRGTYVALVTGAAGGGAQLGLAPAIIVDEHICGTRYVVGAGSGGALVQAAAALARGALPADAVEAGRSAARGGEAPVNLVRQRADALLSHADSRAGGLAARF